MAVLSENHEVAYPDVGPEPTLGVLASRLVRSTVPGRLYQVLQLALPVAIDLAMRGWWRGAGWALAVAAFGGWGLAHRWIAESAADNPSRARWVRVIRFVSGTLAAVPPIILLLEQFVRLLGKSPIS